MQKSCIDRNTDKIIPLKSMVIYINLIPKSTIRAFLKFNFEMLEWMRQAEYSKKFDSTIFRKIDTKLFSAIYRSISRKSYFLIDIDFKNFSLLFNISSRFNNEDIVWISETHGGYHVIIKRNKQTGFQIGKLMQNNKKNMKIELKKEVSTPVPGTLQGGVKVKRVWDNMIDYLNRVKSVMASLNLNDYIKISRAKVALIY